MRYTVKLPCGRLTWCGRTSCPHAELCQAVLADRAAARDIAKEVRGERAENTGSTGWHGGEAATPARPPLAEPADVVYLYDGSMPGFYCCVYESVYGREVPAAIARPGEDQPSLFEQRIIPTDEARAERVRRSIPQKIGPRAMEIMQKCFLSWHPERELEMLKFLLLGYRLGRQTPYMYGHEDVTPVLEAEKHMMGEAHLLKGFVRFSDYDGVLAATITPKNFILPFITEHFCTRYSCEDFLIYDKTHAAALIYENRQSRIVPMEGIAFPEVSETEQQYRALWKHFYDTVAIEARTNPRCRMTHMPKRYWENMLEVADLL